VPNRPVAAAAVACALLVAGCGGQSPLSKEATSLQALAAEGNVLAADAAKGRSTSVFVRIHSGYLRTAAASSATSLGQRRGAGAKRLAVLAKRVSADLGRLSRSSGDRARQQQLAHDLAQAAAAASKLGKSL
jgi:hypothetical protein